MENEHESAVKLANTVLDRSNADPDDDLATLARQFLRTEERERRLKAALDYILILANSRNPHLGHPRLSDKDCIFCMGYFALNNGAYGYSISGDEYAALAKAKRDGR